MQAIYSLVTVHIGLLSQHRHHSVDVEAIRRSGELLKQFDARGGDRTKSAGTDTFGQNEAAQQAGMSERQQVAAVRVANVPNPTHIIHDIKV